MCAQRHTVCGCAPFGGTPLIHIAGRPQDNLLAVATARSVILLSAGHLGGPRSALDVPPPGRLPGAGAHGTAPSGGSQVTDCLVSVLEDTSTGLPLLSDCAATHCDLKSSVRTGS